MCHALCTPGLRPSSRRQRRLLSALQPRPAPSPSTPGHSSRKEHFILCPCLAHAPPSAWGTCPLPSATPFSFDSFSFWAPYLFVVDTEAPDPLFLVTICTLICWKCQQLLQLSLRFVLGCGVLPPRGCAPPQGVQSQPKTSWFQRYQGLAPLPQFGSTSQGHLSTRVPRKFGWSLAFSLFAGQLLQSCLPHFLTGMCSERPLQSTFCTSVYLGLFPRNPS